MAKKKKKSKRINKKARVRICLFFLTFGSILGYLGYNFFLNVYKIMEIMEEKQSLTNKLTSLQSEEDILNSDIKKLKDPEYVARYVREKYLYSKDGELIIRIPDDQK